MHSCVCHFFCVPLQPQRFRKQERLCKQTLKINPKKHLLQQMQALLQFEESVKELVVTQPPLAPTA